MIFVFVGVIMLNEKKEFVDIWSSI